MSISAPAAPPRQQQPQRAPAAGGGTYNEQLHPRGRGGKWIVSKGAGYGAGGPDQTTKQLQERLQQLGFHVPSDGKFGPQTEEAVKAFQQRYGLDPSGGVDPATVELMQTPPDQTLAQVRAAKAAVSKAASTAARKTATARAKAKSTARTSRVRRGAQTGAGGRTGGVAPGTSTAVTGVGHMGAGMLNQGTGMQGKPAPAVSNLQAALNQAGYKLTKDGRFGPQTEAAVKQLQKDHGLAADGIVGPATKALLVGLESSASPAKTTKTTKKVNKQKQKPLPGEVATLRTQAPHARHGSRSAGSRMKLQGPPGQVRHLKYSRDDVPDPDIEEGTWTGGNKIANTTTAALGVGGDYSRSIKDARDNEPTPLVDQPVWDRQQRIADPPDRTIPDGRDEGSQLPVSTVIPDGRDLSVDVQAALTEAVAARKAATDGRTFARALARERVLRARLQEAGPFEERLHPRGRGGKWAEVLGRLKGLKVNQPSEVHGAQAMRLSTGHYVAGGGVHRTPEAAAHAVAVAPYFDLSQPHEMVPIDKLRPTKIDPESSYRNAADRMDAAARGGMEKRKPVTVQVGGDGRPLIVDGHATVEALRRKGITHVPAEVRPRASNLNPDTPKEAIREQTRLDRAAIEVERQKRAQGARERQIAGAERLAMLRRDDARARQVRGSQALKAELDRYTAVLQHPAHGTVELPVTASTPEGAQIAAELTGLGTVQSLKRRKRR